MDQPGQITRLLRSHASGDDAAFHDLIELVYPELRAIAHRQLRRGGRDQTLNTTALVHEAFVKLASAEGGVATHRTHFMAVAATAMRQILIDYARRQNADKRGGDRVRVPLRPGTASRTDDVIELLELDDALTRLEDRSPRLARVVECRFYGGMTVPETADALDISVRTVERDWTRARTYLHQMLA